jgi:dihydroorotate dehydrogenase electron transfer subunit
LNLHRVRVLECKTIGEHALLRYEWSGAKPEPGQFVGAKAQDSSDPFLPRPFFVHDAGEDEISLLFKVRGRGTKSLLNGGAHLLASAPRGRGFDLDAPESTSEDGPAALIGGGVWVAPLKLLSRRLQERRVRHDIFLEAPPGAHGAHGAHDDYLSWLRLVYPGARMIPTDGSPGTFVAALDGLGGYGPIYVSGDRDTLRRAGSDREDAQLAVRERMACMDGSCYGCVVPARSGERMSYERVCVEGPVFRARDLVW